MGHVGFSITTGVFLALSFFSWKSENTKAEKPLYFPSATSVTVSSTVAYTSEHENIAKTLTIVAQLWKITDINRDGLYNCIDAAVLFYKYYPDKNKVCIELNINPNTGMNHLFNCVFTDGVWKAIEPQAYYNNRSNYLMWAVWGSKYDSKYNSDVTDKYKIYAR